MIISHLPTPPYLPTYSSLTTHLLHPTYYYLPTLLLLTTYLSKLRLLTTNLPTMFTAQLHIYSHYYLKIKTPPIYFSTDQIVHLPPTFLPTPRNTTPEDCVCLFSIMINTILSLDSSHWSVLRMMATRSQSCSPHTNTTGSHQGHDDTH